MARPSIPKEQKEREGAVLQAAYDAARAEDQTLTQDALMSRLNKTQGLFGQWIKGTTPIPDKHLIWLGGELAFDPFELRPSLADYFPSKPLAGRGAVIAKFLTYCETANEPDFQRFAAIVEAYVGEIDSRQDKQ